MYCFVPLKWVIVWVLKYRDHENKESYSISVFFSGLFAPVKRDSSFDGKLIVPCMIGEESMHV